MHVAIAGGGIFGATAARALAGRGHRVTLVDPGPLPHPLAESTDISKVVRLDYGADAAYTELAERALDGWRAWNRGAAAPLFHETGVMFISRDAMRPGGFEHDSFALLSARGHRLERLDAAAIARRFPAWRAGAFVDGYYNPAGGWVEASRVVERVLAEAAALGVELRAGCPARAVAGEGDRLLLADGGQLAADAVLVAAGAWTPLLSPELAGALRPRGQAVFHLRPRAAADFAADRFPVFGADIARTGFYGFPLHAGVVKLGHHGPGVETDMRSDERAIPPEIEGALRALLADALPGLADAEVVFRRLCVYCDTRDEHFWIARDPQRPRLTVAAGGSGHAFKFAPVLGDLIADAVVGAPVPARYGWRPEARTAGEEAARFRG